ncbi:MAG: response regulator [Dehalococcoidia bacterium]|nr:response regulator [Dehalococcoidia bacterium]
MPNERILVVDDEAPVRESLMRVLRAVSYQVDGAASGAEALEKLAASPYDLLVADIRMPGMDGLEMMRQAKKRDPHVAGLFLTGYGNIDTAIEALDLGVQGFVLKPATPDKLLRSVEQALIRVRADREASRLRALTPLLEVSRALVAEVDLESLFSLILKLVQQETRADRASLMMVDDDGKELVIRAAYGLPQEYIGSRRKVQDTIAGTVLQRGEPLLIQSGASTPPDMQREMTARDTGSALCLPLKAKGKVIGVMNLSKQRGNAAFTRSDMELFTVLAGQVAAAIENARLYGNLKYYSKMLEHDKKDLEQRMQEIRGLNTFLQSQQAQSMELSTANRALEEQYRGLIRSLPEMVDARCPERREHSRTVAALAVSVAQVMGLAREDVEEAAYLHDIGMAVLRDELLNRRGALSSPEQETVIKHPETGAKLLSDAHIQPSVRDTVLYHHENFDGSGYPLGLAREAIPLPARIIRVVDSLEAMTAARPYRKKALSREEAMTELRNKSGKFYDPQVVAALEKALQQADEEKKGPATP